MQEGVSAFTFMLFASEAIVLVVLSLFLLFNPPIPGRSVVDSNRSGGRLGLRKNPNPSEISKFAEQLIRNSTLTYIQSCVGSDYLQPLSHACLNQSGIGLTAIDSLDSIILTGDSDLYDKLYDFVSNKFTCEVNKYVSFHDLTSHVIGGLISAYALSKDKLFLEKAVECGHVAMKSFSNSRVPNAFVHGKKGTSKQNEWVNGISLNDASAFLIEMYSLSALSGDKSFKKAAKSFLQCIKELIELHNNIPLFVSNQCTANEAQLGLSSINAGFVSNLLRLHIFKRGQLTGNLVTTITNLMGSKTLKTLMLTPNATVARFDASFCEFVPLLEQISPTGNKFTSKILEKCKVLADEGFPQSSGILQKSYLDIDDKSMSFDSGLLENSLLKGEPLSQVIHTENLGDWTCGNVPCSRQGSAMIDFMPPEAVNRWAKMLLLDGSNVRYSNYVINEAGHIIPME